MEIKGIDTIEGLVGEPPNLIELPRDYIVVGESLRQLWNSRHIAFLPYCFKCKIPLIWHTPLEPDNTIFHCDGCKRRWTVGGKDDKAQKVS